MAILLDGKTLEPSLPHRPVTPVMLMIAPDVIGHPPLHEGIEFFTGSGRDHEMEMVGHQAEAENLNGMPGFGLAEYIKKGLVVPILSENGRAPVSTIQNMERMPSDLSSWNPWHGFVRYANQ